MTIAAVLQQRNIRTANSFHQDGCYFGFYDLANNFGSAGATLAATKGRYVWVVSPDHPSGTDLQTQSGGWFGGQHICIGYSDDPGVMPTSLTPIWRSLATSGDPRNVSDLFVYYHFGDLVYNPDDATYPFYLYCEGYVFSGPDSGVASNHETGLLRSIDLTTWVGYGGTHLSDTFSGFTSFQRVIRTGANDWYSIGPHYLGDPGETSFIGKWTSSDARTWTTNPAVDVLRTLGNVTFNDIFGKPLSINISGQDYLLCREDARADDGGMYFTAVPIDVDFNVLASPAKIRLSPKYEGNFPDLSYFQSASVLLEDGILHVYLSHGFFSDEANPGDGMHEQAYDYYTVVVDATAAANAAPAGVRAECRQGAVILSWYNALPNKTYRVYRSTNGGSSYSSLGDVTGLNFVDPVGDVGATYFYKVVTRHSGADQGYRIVSTYVSNGRSLTNKHVTRAAAAGATNINVGWLDTVATWLRDNALTNRLLYWADPSFGVIKNGSNEISKVFCLGSTLHNYGGDYTPTTPASTTYSATGLNSAIPAWVNGAATAHGYFGGNFDTNNIRRKAETTFGAVYSRSSGSSDATFLATSEFGGIVLQHASGTPGQINFNFKNTGYNITATKIPASATSAQFSAGTFDGTNLVAYSNGVAGTAELGVLDNILLDGQRGTDNGGQTDFLGSGSADVKYNHPSHVFDDNQGAYSCSSLIVFDKALSAAQVKSLNTLIQARISGTSYSLPAYSVPLVKNIVTDYSATGNGSTDDAPAFGTFGTAAAGYNGLVVLQVPAGSFKFHTDHSGFTSQIPLFLLLGESRDTTSLVASLADAGYFLGSKEGTFFTEVGMDSARVQTATVGDSSVTLVTSGQASIFTVGQYVVVAAGDLQGFGDPINPINFEFKKITNISGGVITFDSVLENTYKSTWPLYNSGADYLTGGGGDKGGPATIFRLSPNWDCEHEYAEVDLQQIGEIKAPGRFITYTRCRCTAQESGTFAEVFPSENFHWIANDLEMTGIRIEVDKVIDTATINGGIYKAISFQSSSPNTAEVGGCVIVQEDMLSSPRNIYLDGFNVVGELRFGPTSYGVSDKVVALNGSAGSLAQGGFSTTGIVAAGYTMAGGIISASKHDLGPLTWAVPGHTLIWSAGSAGNADTFVVTDLSDDGTNTLVHTDQLAGFTGLSGTLGIKTHPAPKFIMRGVVNPFVGSAVVSPTPSGNSFNCVLQDLSHVTPFAPLYSRSTNRYYGGNINLAPAFTMFGKIVSIEVRVPVEYTGVQSTLLMHLFGQFGGRAVHPDGTQALWDPQIDTKTTGTRIITPSGVTGAVGSDANLDMPDTPLWITDILQPWLNHDVSGESAVGPGTQTSPVLITYVLDQSQMNIDPGTAGPILRINVVRWH